MAKEAEQKPKDSGRKGLYAGFFVGLLLFGAGLYIGQRTELSETFKLDFKGQRAEAKAERLREGLYRLTYTHPSGDIYSRTYTGNRGVPKPGDDGGRLLVAYDPERPNEFQPAGLSYLPLAAVIVLSAAGASLVFYANHRLVRARRNK